MSAWIAWIATKHNTHALQTQHKHPGVVVAASPQLCVGGGGLCCVSVRGVVVCGEEPLLFVFFPQHYVVERFERKRHPFADSRQRDARIDGIYRFFNKYCCGCRILAPQPYDIFATQRQLFWQWAASERGRRIYVLHTTRIVVCYLFYITRMTLL